MVEADIPQTDPRLRRAAHAAQRLAGGWVAALDEADREELVVAFHRAEALAAAALETALTQVEDRYRAELTEQLADEARHVDVFARWLSSPPTFGAPRPRERPTSVWLMLLLANELTGYCQFHMLLALLGDAGRRAQVLTILQDEERHIARLEGWLARYRGTPEATVLRDLHAAHSRGLIGRMGQFFPRRDLDELREGMAEVCAELLAGYHV